MLEELHVWATSNGGEFPIVADLEEGYTIKFRAQEEEFNKSKFFKFKSFYKYNLIILNYYHQFFLQSLSLHPLLLFQDVSCQLLLALPILLSP